MRSLCATHSISLYAHTLYLSLCAHTLSLSMGTHCFCMHVKMEAQDVKLDKDTHKGTRTRTRIKGHAQGLAETRIA